jgi:D-alanine-D-alanine ligase
MARVGVVFGGRSVEHRVSVLSARTVAGGLTEAGHEVVALGIAEDGCWIGAEASEVALAGGVDALAPLGISPVPTLRHLLGAKIDVVFPIVHGTWGEDGTLQGLLEMLDLPYVGAGVTASALAMDKLLAKRQLRDAGLPVVEFEGVSRQELEAGPGRFLARAAALPFPVFVKPSVGGSSVGVRKVEEPEGLEAAVREALRFDDRVLVERGVDGRELECAVLGYPELAASAVGEIVPGNEFYDYSDKYLDDGAQLFAPAEVPPAVEQRVRELAVAALAALHGDGMARVDFFLEGEDRVLVNEVNTHPGFTRISMYPRLWALAGLPLPQLVDRLVELAVRRHRDRRRLDLGIKGWLRELERRA